MWCELYILDKSLFIESMLAFLFNFLMEFEPKNQADGIAISADRLAILNYYTISIHLILYLVAL